jgi:hypothetical protein
MNITRDNTLDLHGVRHHEVSLQVENFVLLNQNILPLHIVCGNSTRMMELVKQALDDIKVQYVPATQYGKLTVIKI